MEIVLFFRCCTFDTTTATNFAGHFGYLVTIQAIMMVVMILLITAAMFFALFTQDFGQAPISFSRFVALSSPKFQVPCNAWGDVLLLPMSRCVVV